jgi:hypothetical protein
MDPALTREVISILNQAHDMTIATVREDGYPQATAVSYVNDGLIIYFGCVAESQKAKNIARCDKVSLTVNLYLRKVGRDPRSIDWRQGCGCRRSAGEGPGGAADVPEVPPARAAS